MLHRATTGIRRAGDAAGRRRHPERSLTRDFNAARRRDLSRAADVRAVGGSHSLRAASAAFRPAEEAGDGQDPGHSTRPPAAVRVRRGSSPWHTIWRASTASICTTTGRTRWPSCLRKSSGVQQVHALRDHTDWNTLQERYARLRPEKVDALIKPLALTKQRSHTKRRRPKLRWISQ